MSEEEPKSLSQTKRFKRCKFVTEQSTSQTIGTRAAKRPHSDDNQLTSQLNKKFQFSETSKGSSLPAEIPLIQTRSSTQANSVVNRESEKVLKKKPKILTRSSTQSQLHVDSVKQQLVEQSDKSKSELFDLPDEILIKIIGYLPTNDIVRRVTLVSKKMNSLSKDSSVGISVNSETVNSVLAIPERARQVMQLDLYRFSLSVDQIVGMKNLKTIKILNELEPQRTILFHKEFIEGLTQLKNLRNVNLFGQFEKSSLNKVGDLKHLKQIEMTIIAYKMSKQDLKSLSELREVPVLNLNLYECILCPSERACFPENFKINKNCKQKIRINIKEFSEMWLVLSHFPNVGNFITLGQPPPPVAQKEISDLHSLLAKCENLRAACLKCDSSNREMLRNTFIGWKTEENDADYWLFGEPNLTKFSLT